MAAPTITPVGFRALIVDDDEMSRTVAVSILRRLGATEVTAVEHGPAALAWAEATHRTVDLVLCDLRMPQLDGLETLDGLSVRTYPRLFVLVSGADSRALRAASASASARLGPERVRVVAKPLSVNALETIVDELTAPQSPAELGLELLRTRPVDCSTDMVAGMSRGEFVSVFQPRIDTRSRQVVNAQALLRWRHPRLGMLPAEAFLPVAEAIGSLRDLFLTAFAQAVADLQVWRHRGHRAGLAIGIPGQLLADRDVPRHLEDVLGLQRCQPDAITLEIDESAWLRDVQLAREMLTRLRLRGFALSIDRFGTGLSTIRQLIDAPFTEMKLDRSYFGGAANDRETAIALTSYIAIARKLDMTVVADGVDTAGHEDFVAGLDIDQMQGDRVSPPVVADEFAAALDATLLNADPA